MTGDADIAAVAALIGDRTRARFLLRAANTAHALNYARFCYDHLAGCLAIELVDAMTKAGLITRHAALVRTRVSRLE
jgi:hypothetical protein